MSNREYRRRLQRLLFLIRKQQAHDSNQVAATFNCHRSTAKRLIVRLRLEGHQIKYDKGLKRYVLVEED